GGGLVRESGLVEDGIHELARRVASEWTSSAVRAMSAGGQSHDEDSGIGIAEAGDGFSPVFPLAVGTTLLARDLLAIDDQARTTRAGNHVPVENGKPRHSVITPYPPRRSSMDRSSPGMVRRLVCAAFPSLVEGKFV